MPLYTEEEYECLERRMTRLLNDLRQEQCSIGRAQRDAMRGLGKSLGLPACSANVVVRSTSDAGFYDTESPCQEPAIQGGRCLWHLEVAK